MWWYVACGIVLVVCIMVYVLRDLLLAILLAMSGNGPDEDDTENYNGGQDWPQKSIVKNEKPAE